MHFSGKLLVFRLTRPVPGISELEHVLNLVNMDDMLPGHVKSPNDFIEEIDPRLLTYKNELFIPSVTFLAMLK